MFQDLHEGNINVIVTRDLELLLRTLQDLIKLFDLNNIVVTVDIEFRSTRLKAVIWFKIR